MIAAEEFGRGVMDLTLVLTDKDGYYTVEDQLTVPDHSRLEVYASNYMHTAIKSSGNGVEEDSTRCPTKIHLLEHKIIDRGGDSSYTDLSLYVSVLVGAHASMKFRGVTIIEEHKENHGETDPYHEGSIHLRGHSASIEVWDSRVEFSQLSFINSHGNGITFASLMHVRFIASAATVPVLYPLTALKGHTVSGNELVSARTDAVLGSSNLKWCENGDDA